MSSFKNGFRKILKPQV